MEPKLTFGALKRIVSGERVENAILQVLNYRAVNDARGEQNRFRMMIHDGVTSHGHTMVIAPHLVEKVINGEMEKYTVFKLTKYVINKLESGDKTVLIIQDMSIVASATDVGHRLGNPLAADGVLTNPVPAAPSRSLNSSVTGPNATSAFDAGFSTAGINTNAKVSNNQQRVFTESEVCPITAITPYFNAWVIRGRVTSKSQIRQWSNPKGEGTLFSFDVTDESSEIRITAFKKECEKFYDMIEVDKVYYITRGNVKAANKRFSNTNNDYEIALTSDSIIQIAEDVGTIPKLRYKFIEIKDLINVNPSSFADIIGIIVSIDDCGTLISRKTNKELKKRDIMIVDKSTGEVRFTLWNNAAEEFNASLHSVIAIKCALVGDYGGRTLSLGGGTSFQIDPDIPEAHILKGWYAREGQNMQFNALSKVSGGGTTEWKFLSQINPLTITEQRVYYNTVGTIIGVGRNPMYKSCTTKDCIKKVQDENNGLYRCDKCGKESPNFAWRFIVSVQIADCTGEVWSTLFQENAEKLLGISPQDLSYHQEHDEAKYNEILHSICFKTFNFRFGSQLEQYNSETRVKTVVYSAVPMDTVKQCRKLLQSIASWSN